MELLKDVKNEPQFTDIEIMPRDTHAPSKRPSTRTKTLNDYANEFLAETHNANTRKSYAQDIRHFLGALGVSPDVSDEFLLVYKEVLISESSPRTARRRLSVIKSFLDSLVLKGALDRNLYAHMKHLSPRVDKYDSPTIALTDEEVRRMVNHPDRSTLLGSSQRMALVMGFHLGLRVSEMARVRIADISADGFLRVMGKGNKVRSIAIDDMIMEEIRGHYDVTSMLFNRTRDESEYLLVGQKNKAADRPMDSDTVNLWFKDVAKACGIDKRVTSHTGRATAITKLLDEEVPLRDVGVFAGHSSMDTTMIYDKKRRETPEKVVKKIRY